MSVNLVTLAGLNEDGSRSERDSKMHQEMLRFNRWKRTVNKIEALGGIPKINLDNLDRNQNLFHGKSLAGRLSLFSREGSEREPTSRLKRAPKLNQKHLPQKRSQAQDQSMQAHEFKRFLSVEHDALDASLGMNSMKRINGEIPSFRRVSSYVGTAEGFELFEESALFGKSAGSFENTEGLMNPSSGNLEPKNKVLFRKVNSFSSVKSGDDGGSLFDFSTVNTDQKNLILGALPLMPKKPKSVKQKEEQSQKTEGDGSNGGSRDDGKGKHQGKSSQEQGDGSTSTPLKSESGMGKESENRKTSPGKDEISKREKVGATEKAKVEEQIGPLEDEDGNVREYTKLEKKIILKRYKEKKRKRSFKKVNT